MTSFIFNLTFPRIKWPNSAPMSIGHKLPAHLSMSSNIPSSREMKPPSNQNSGLHAIPRPSRHSRLLFSKAQYAQDHGSLAIGSGVLNHPTTLSDPEASYMCHDDVATLEKMLDKGKAIGAMKTFNDILYKLDGNSWRPRLRAVLREWSYSGEASMAIFTLVLFKVQCGIRSSERTGKDCMRRDEALKKLILPVAGEYGLQSGKAIQGHSHRDLYRIMCETLLQENFSDLLSDDPKPELSYSVFERMLKDLYRGGLAANATEECSYALGYNLATEYLGDFEFKLMLPTFQMLAAKHVPHHQVDLSFIKLHAEGAEEEHAAIANNAIETLVPKSHYMVMQKAIADYDRELASWYHGMCNALLMQYKIPDSLVDNPI